MKYFIFIFAICAWVSAISQEEKKSVTKEQVIFRLNPANASRLRPTPVVRTLNYYLKQNTIKYIPDNKGPQNLQALLDYQIIYCQLTICYDGMISEVRGKVFDTYITPWLASGTKIFFEDVIVQDSIGNRSKIKKIVCVVK